MQVIFERGNRDAPVGHALIYFRTDADTILATYVSVPPIRFDLTTYMPGFMAGAMQGMNLGDAMMAAPMPPIPEAVPNVAYLEALAERRQDDLVCAGAIMASDPMRLASEAQEAAQAYGDLYGASAPAPETKASAPDETELERLRLRQLNEQEQLDELTKLVGRLRDSLGNGAGDPALEQQMRTLTELLPTKYRGYDLVEAARSPGETGQRLATLYLERCYKLYHEQYLDLERIDREIEATRG